MVNSDTTKNIDGFEWIILSCSITNQGEIVRIVEKLAGLGYYHVIEIAMVNYGSKVNDAILN